MNKTSEERLTEYLCEWCEENSEEANISAQEIQDFVFEKGGDIMVKTILCQGCWQMHDQQMAYAAAS